MANNYITPRDVARVSMVLLKNRLGFTRGLNRQYEKELKNPQKNGGEVSIKLPPQYSGRRGWEATPEDTQIGYINLTLDEPYGQDVIVSHADMVLNVEDFGRLVAAPIINRIGQNIEVDMLKLIKQLPNQVGTPGQITGGSMTIDQGKQALSKCLPRMANMAADLEQSFMGMITPTMQSNLAASFSGMFNPQAQAGKMFSSGDIGMAFGVDWSVSQSLPTHTNGSQVTSGGGRPTTGGAAQAGTWNAKNETTFPLSVAALGGTVTKGSTFTIDGIFAVNPASKINTLELMQFVVRNDAAANATSLDIWPIPIFSGPFQNVTSASNGIPANTGITIDGTANQTFPLGFVIDRDCITFASVELPAVEGSGQSYTVGDPESGLSLRVWITNEWRNAMKAIRYDVMIGATVTRPTLGVRLAG